jgi:predicted amidohydrolase YtcJ
VSARTAADLAILGARVRTLDPERPHAEAVAWRDGTIVAVGSDAEVRAACDARTELVDGAGTVLCPGLVDAHIHPFFVEQTRGADLTRCATLAEVNAALARERERLREGEWLLGWGLEYNAFGEQPIDGRTLLQGAGDAPALLTFMDVHTAVATPRALELAGVRGAERFEGGAAVVVDARGPTGELREQPAMDLVRHAVPPLSSVQVRAGAVAMLRRLNALGIAGGHVMDGDPGTFELLRELEADGELTVRLVVPLWLKPEMDDDELRAHLELAGERGRRWRGGVAKFFIDGVIDSGTAWLCEPDELGDGTAPYWPDPERYARAVREFAAAGFQCVTHAVGDRAVRAALDAYGGAARVGAPHRVEHIELLHPEDLARFAAQGVAASMQPLHMQWRRPDGEDSWTRRVGRERARWAFPTRALLDAGVLVALGSDWPIAGCDPREGMAWARLRRPVGRPDAEAFEPDQRMTAEEALRGYTISAAEIVGEQALAGRAREGLRADLTGFADDPTDCPADELPELPITLTVVDGTVVHRV